MAAGRTLDSGDCFIGITTNPPAPLTPSFERERCPYNARQLNDLNKSEAERRSEALAAYKSRRREHAAPEMIRKQANIPTLKPSPRLAAGVDHRQFTNDLAKDDNEAKHLTYMATRMAQRADRARRQYHSHQDDY